MARERLIRVRAMVLRLGGVLSTAATQGVQAAGFQEALTALQGVLAYEVSELGEVVVQIEGSRVRVNGSPVAELGRDPAPELAALFDLASARGCGGFRFLRAPAVAELHAFTDLWHRHRLLSENSGYATLNEGLQQRSVDSLVILPPIIGAEGTSDVSLLDASPLELLGAYAALLAAATRLHDRTLRSPVELRPELDSALRTMADLAVNQPRQLLPLTAHRLPGRYEAIHATNRTVLSMLLARRIGLSLEAIVDVGRAAMGCDVGMVHCAPGVRDETHELTEQQTLAILDHPREAFGRWLQTDRLGPSERAILVVAAEHHCGVDGQGYPDPPPGGSPHLYSRIVAIADAFDALVQDRGDRAAVARPLALEAMTDELGTRYDPVLMDHFCALLGRFPPGSVVRLREGHIAMVLLPDEDPRMFDRPEIVLLREPSGRLMPTPTPMKLGKQRGGQATAIVEVLDDRLFPERLLALLFGGDE
jgi:HD-GYP domain-containing protein (c-di-GMP phosphodiesterase class II)